MTAPHWEGARMGKRSDWLDEPGTEQASNPYTRACLSPSSASNHSTARLQRGNEMPLIVTLTPNKQELVDAQASAAAWLEACPVLT